LAWGGRPPSLWRTLRACRVDALHPRISRSRRRQVSSACASASPADHSRLHRKWLLADRNVCPTGIRHRRSGRAIFKPDRTPLLRFLSLSALAGRVALAGVAVSRPIPLRRCPDESPRSAGYRSGAPGDRSESALAAFRSASRARFSPTCDDCEMLSALFSRVATLAASMGETTAECEEASSVLRAVRRDIPATARQPCRTEPRSRLPPVTDHSPRSFQRAAFRYRPIRASAAWPNVRTSPARPAALIGFSNGPSQVCSRGKVAGRFRPAGPTCRLPSLIQTRLIFVGLIAPPKGG